MFKAVFLAALASGAVLFALAQGPLIDKRYTWDTIVRLVHVFH
jgi:hypothetical protein